MALVEHDDTGFCIAAPDEAMARHGRPKIFNTDQGAQLTSSAFTGRLEAAGIAISIDGRGRFMDNIFIERLWYYGDSALNGRAALHTFRALSR